MLYIENVFICLAAPMLLTLFLLKDSARKFNVFFIIGMTVCFLASYVNTYVFSLTEYNTADATIYLSPINEEILKALPVLLYVLIFKPKKNDIILSALAIGIGFATLENCCYITLYGSSERIFALIRGFASGIMHAVCTATIGYGMCYAYQRNKLDYILTFGLLSTSITYHSIYNMLVSGPENIRIFGCLMPVATVILGILIIYRGLIANIKNRLSVENNEINLKGV